jgi:hypothetical protein
VDGPAAYVVDHGAALELLLLVVGQGTGQVYQEVQSVRTDSGAAAQADQTLDHACNSGSN